MTSNSPSASERRDDVSDRTEQQTLARTVGASLASREWTWIAAAVAGGALLLRGLLTARDRRGRGLLQAVAGGALLAAGYTRRGTGAERRGETGEVSDDAHLEIERPATEENPRDVTDDPDAVPSSEDEGDIQFSTDQKDDLEGPRDGDADPDDDAVEVDLSEAAVADEPGEAAGPTSAQAEPTTTKTDLSPPSGVEEPDVDDGLESGSGDDSDGVDGSDAGDEDAPVETTDSGEGTVETEGGAEVHTDTMESGTMDVDEEDVTDDAGEPIDDAGVEELSDNDPADYRASEGDGEETTEQTEGGAEVHTDTNEAGTMDVDEEDVDGEDADDED